MSHDIPAGDADPDAIRALAALHGLATTTATMLVAIGVRSEDDISRLGPVEAYLRLRARFDRVSLNFLYGLEAIEVGCSWRDITPERKAQLRAEVAEAQAAGNG